MPVVYFAPGDRLNQLMGSLQTLPKWLWLVVIVILIVAAGYTLRNYIRSSVLKYHPRISPEDKERRRVAEIGKRQETAQNRRWVEEQRSMQRAEAQASAVKAGGRRRVDRRAAKPEPSYLKTSRGSGGAQVDQIEEQLRGAKGFRPGARGDSLEPTPPSRAAALPKATPGGLDSIDSLVQNVDRMIAELSSGIAKLSETARSLETDVTSVGNQIRATEESERKSREALGASITRQVIEKIENTQAGLKSEFETRLGSLKGTFVDPVVRSIQGIEKSLKEQISEAEKNWKLAELEKEYVLIAWDLYANAARTDQLRNRQKAGEHIDIESLEKLVKSTRKTLQEFKDRRFITGGDELDAADKLKDRLDTLEAMLEKIKGSNDEELEKYVKDNFQVLFLPTVYPDEETLQDVSYEVIGRFGADQALGRLARFTHYVLPIAIGDLLKDRKFTSINPKQGDVFDETRHNAVRPIPTTDPNKQNKIHSVIRPGLEYKGKVPVKAQVVRLIKP